MPRRRSDKSQFCIGTQASLPLSLPLVQNVDKLSSISRSRPSSSGSSDCCPSSVPRYYAILHSGDGTIVYVNRSQEPAYWGANEVKTDIDYYSRQIGARPANITPMPSRPGFPDGKIAIWGDVILERIVDAQSLKLLAVEKNPKLGVLVDFIGDYARSAKNDLPVYRILGGPGFVWSASYNSDGKGTLRFLAINPSAFYSAIIAGPTTPPTPPKQPQVPVPGDTTYTTIGWWSIMHRRTGSLDGCMASSRFTDGTLFEMALIQSGREKPKKPKRW